MSRKKSLFFVSFCLLSLTSNLIFSPLLSQAAQAQSPQKNQQQVNRNYLRIAAGFKPPGKKAPGTTIGAATRQSTLGVCPEDTNAIDRSVTALLSSAEQSLTSQERPTLFVYVPQTNAKQISLSIKDDTEDYYYEKTFSLPQGGGILGVNLPQDAPALKSGKTYNWSMTVVCGNAKRPGDPYVSGQIQKVEPKQAYNNASLSDSDKAVLYGQDGIWYDTLTSLAKLKQTKPEDKMVTEAWEKILESVGLKAIAIKPLKSVN